VLIVVLRAELPAVDPTSDLRYPQLLASVGTLLRQHPTLRIRCVLGALNFAAFSIFWTTLAFLLAGSPYHYGDAVIGLFGLAGAAGALVAGQAGKLSDRGQAHVTTAVFTALVGLSFLPIFLGAHHLVPLIIGVVVLDLGVQGLQITNQSEIYKLDPAARSRITTAYMTCYFAGGAIGSAAGAALWSSHGWGGVSLAGGIVGAVALLLGTQTRRLARREGLGA
jgi:predicted MFS family arabinose efflux permease